MRRFIAKQIIGNQILIVIFLDIKDCLMWVKNDLIHRQYINASDPDYLRIMQNNKYRRYAESSLIREFGYLEYK